MIINCGNRRLVSDRFGWKIEIHQQIQSGKREGQWEWREDRPAYPATLAQGCEMLCERILKEGGDIALTGLPEACKNAAHEVRRYMEMARMAA